MKNIRSSARFEQWANRSLPRFACLVPLFALAMACGGSLSASAGVNIAAPQSGATVTSPVQVSASVTGHQIKTLQLYVDSKLTYSVGASSLSTSQTLAAGSHSLKVQAIDSRGNTYSKSETITVASSPTTTPVAVSISPSSAVLQVSKSQQFSSAVSGTTDTAITWKVNGIVGGNSTVGQITTTGDYLVPSIVPSGGAVTVTAQSQADPTKAANAAVTITSAPTTVTVTVSPTTASVSAGTTKQFAATVSGTTNTAVTWSVNGVTAGNATYGTISSNGVYTAPACPSVNSVTVTATSAYDTSAKANAAVTVSGSQVAGSGGTYYVSASGSNSNPGSACSPWGSISHAASVVGAGSTVIVQDGTYYENLVLTHSGTASSPIVFKSQNKWGAKVVPVNISSNLNYFSGANYVTLQDFEFTSSGSYVSVIKIDSGQHNSIIGNKIHDTDATPTCSAGHGVLVADSYNTISGNLIYNVGPPRSAPRCNQNHGIYITAGSYGTVTDNLLMEVWQGVAIHMAGIDLSHWTIANNTVVNSGTNITGSGTSSGGPEILYCEGGTCDYNTYSNNIFANTQGGYCYIEQNAGGTIGSHNQYLNNLLYSCGSNIFTTGSLQSTVTSAPQFVNYTGDANGDYHLQSTSPAIDHGSSVGCPKVDFDDWLRPTGTACDIGAFEYHP